MGGWATAGGALAGILGGATSNQKEGGKDTGNVFQGTNAGLSSGALQGNISDALAQSSKNNYNYSAGDVMGNAITGQIYGQGGLFGQTLNQEKDLANNGFNLTDTDKTAYGEASGNIARQFGQNDASLSQALSDRGLDSSGVAGQTFSNSLGNKNEQLAGLQTSIAQQRMQMNQQRLAQTQNFLGQLGSQANTDINSDFNAKNEAAKTSYGMASGYLKDMQGQSDEQLQQQQQTQHGSTLSNIISGATAGAGAGASMGSSMASANNQQSQAKMFGSMS